MRKAISVAIDRLLDLYGAPAGTVDGFSSALENVLSDFTDEQVSTAVDHVIATFVRSAEEPWPAPARFVRAATGPKKKDAVYNSVIDDATRARNDQIFNRATSKAINEIVSTSIGHKAIRESWVRELKNIAWQTYKNCEIQNRQPPSIEAIAQTIVTAARKPRPWPETEAVCCLGSEHTELIKRILASEAA